jgi:hypothetical protein
LSFVPPLVVIEFPPTTYKRFPRAPRTAQPAFVRSVNIFGKDDQVFETGSQAMTVTDVFDWLVPPTYPPARTAEPL